MKNSLRGSIFVIAFFTISQQANAGFAQGFQIGAEAAQRGIESGQKDAELRRRWNEMRIKYGTPELDNFNQIEKNIDTWFLRAKNEIEDSKK